jgi:hypothetical protein
MSLGLLETPFLSITGMACDAALKSADVILLGLESIGTQVILSARMARNRTRRIRLRRPHGLAREHNLW